MAAAGRAAGPVHQPNSAVAPGRAIRGIPIVFPWFGASRRMPTAPQHGFARVATWHLDGVETAGGRSLTLTLSLDDGDVGDPVWRGMVCVETGNIADNEVRLAADAEYRMSTAISVAAAR